jgi:hypothetical protein
MNGMTILRRASIAFSLLALLSTGWSEATAQTAGDLICNGCVNSRDIKNGSVTGADIKDGSLTGKDIKDNSVTGADLANGSTTWLAALIDNEAKVVRSKGLASVTRPSTGHYCITPASAKFPINTYFPILFVEYGYSAGSGNIVQWDSNAGSCQAGQIEVQTFTLNTGNFVPSDDVAFTIIVPR